jgi:hypothetical protein
MNNIIVNILYLFIILYLIYNLYQDYKYDKDHKNEYILCTEDFKKNMNNYSNCELYHKINNLPDIEKKFLDDYIVYTMIKHKSEKPNLNKKINTVKSDIVLPSIIASCLNFSLGSGILSFRQNILQHFASKVI